MPIGKHCVRRVRTASLDETARAAAERMRAEQVGCLVVLDAKRPVGLLTDRDIATQICGCDLDAERVTVRDLASQPPVTIDASASVDAALRKLRRTAVRRLIVVDEAGAVTGLVAADDLLRLLATEVGELGETLRAQLTSEMKGQLARVAEDCADA